MAAPPRPFLTREEMAAMTPAELMRATAEWSSYNARLRREQELQASRGANRGSGFRGGRGRGRGRGYYATPYQPYARLNHRSHSVVFNQTHTPAGTPKTNSARTTPPNSDDKTDYEATTIQELCPQFTLTGKCASSGRGRCRYIHDPHKTAICKGYLHKGVCQKSDCPLSHEPSPNRSPHCTYFQDGRCTKDDCRYAHIHVNADAPVCIPFARLGYCEKGAACADRHQFECPDFANTGECSNEKCQLPHVVHAARLRKARGSAEAESASLSTPSRPESEDDEVMMTNVPSHDFTQQVDYLPLGD